MPLALLFWITEFIIFHHDLVLVVARDCWSTIEEVKPRVYCYMQTSTSRKTVKMSLSVTEFSCFRSFALDEAMTKE